MTLEEFVNLAVGVPFVDRGRTLSGWDCWGLVVFAYKTCFGVVLPGYEGISAFNSAEAGALIDAQKKLWIELPPGLERRGDVIVLRHASWPCHIGLIIRPGLMLHVDEVHGTYVENYRTGICKNQVISFHRHEQLASGGLAI